MKENAFPLSNFFESNIPAGHELISVKNVCNKTSALFRQVTYSVMSVGMMHNASMASAHSMGSETLSTEETVRAKESKEMILQTKLIVVEILQVYIYFLWLTCQIYFTITEIC